MARGQNLLSKVYNKPLLITANELQPIADYLSSPERVASLRFEQDKFTLPKLEDFSNENEYKQALLERLDINPVTKVGVLNIDGVLVNREGQMNSQCVELTSYQGLKKKFEMQVSQGMKSCVLMISSRGGEAFGAWSTANYVKKIAKENNIKLTTYINGSACSAAYVWAVVADEIVSHPMGSSGSIGVLVQLYNDTKMLENMGVQRSFVYAGGNKIPFDEKGEFTEKFISDLQKDVNKTYLNFVDHVATHRNMSKQEVIDTNASVFNADDALSLGLIDKVMEIEDFEIAYGLKAKATGNHAIFLDSSPVQNNQSLQHEEKTIMTDVSVEQLQAQLTSALEEKQTLQDTLSGVQAQLSELTGAKEKLSADFEALKQAKEALELEKAQQEADAIVAKRTAMLEDALGKGNEKVATLLASTATLSEEHFEVIASSLKVEQEAKQEQFQELGGEGQESEKQLSLSEMIAKRAKEKLQQNKTA